MYIMGSLVLMGFCMFYIFLPVFHDLNLISTYKVSLLGLIMMSCVLNHVSLQYLEQRYNRSLRLFGSVMFIMASVSRIMVGWILPGSNRFGRSNSSRSTLK